MLNMALTCLREMKTSCTRSSLSSRLPKREVAVCFISLTVIFEFCCKGMKKPFKQMYHLYQRYMCETYQLFASTCTYIDYQLLNLFYFFNNIVKEVHQTSEKSEKMVFKSW